MNSCAFPFFRSLKPLAAAVALCCSQAALAFDRDLHERLVGEQLPGLGFDEKTTHHVGSAANWVDVVEMYKDETHADNNFLDAASRRLERKMKDIPRLLQSCERSDAVRELGYALHTVADIYAHSNAVDNGFVLDNLLTLAHGSAHCDAANGFAPLGLVSGYFNLWGAAVDQCLGMETGMCCHRDLNKDNPGSPNGARFNEAYSLAGGKTSWYVGEVIKKLREGVSSTQAARLEKMLKERQRTAIFVMDTTGSMSGDISAVQSQAANIVDQLAANGEAPTLGLVTFKDYATFEGKFCDADEFKNAVYSLSASGGGDCPEASNSAMLTGLYRFPVFETDYQATGGNLYVSTDASAGDASLGPEVRATAVQRGVSIDTVLTGDCVAEGRSRMPFSISDNHDGSALLNPQSRSEARAASVDPLTALSARTQLRALSEQTGGVYYQVSRSEVSQVVPTMIEMGAPDNALLRSWKIGPEAGSTAELEIPVDDTLLTQVSFMVSASSSAALPPFVITDPSGRQVNATDAGVTRLHLSSVDKYTITNPAAGNWRIKFQGTANATVRAFGRSRLLLLAARLLDPALPLPNPDIVMMPVEGVPFPGQRLVAELSVTGAAAGIDTVVVRRPDGSEIARLTPAVTRSGYYQIELQAPAEPFLIEAAGSTRDGVRYVRQVKLPVEPQAVALTVTPKALQAALGTQASIDVVIANHGTADAVFDLKASTDTRWSATAPTGVAIPAGGSKSVAVQVSVPANAAPDAAAVVSLIVENQADRRIRNTGTAYLGVITNRPPVCTAARPSVASLWPVNHKLVDVSIQGVTDPDGDPVTLAVTGITQDEPPAVDGSGHTVPDGRIAGAVASVRAERAGGGDGRVYSIAFSAADNRGGSCTGAVQVSVPHDQSSTAVDSGQAYDSTK